VDYPDSDDLQTRVDSIMTDYSDEERAPSTRRTYRKAWNDFTDFCEALEVEALPAAGETVAQYVLYCAEDRELKAATLRKRLSAVRYFHRKNEHRSPTREAIVEEAMEQIRRRQGTSQRQADPLLKSDVTRMLDELHPGRPEPEGTADRADWMRDIRDAALIAVGFAGAFRRGELRKIAITDLRLSADRVRIRLPQ